jgi:hydroxymethylpyrimidine pyrophosphatase-like HAD family hydrolase
VLYGTGDGIPSESGHYVTGDPARIERDPQTFGPRDVWAEVPAHDQVKANVFCGGGREHLVQVRDALRSEFPAFDFVLPSNVAPIVDIMPRGWNKGSGVRVLAQALGIGLDEVATFGDSENDLGMIEGFPNSVAVGNASEEVRRAAKWHIGRSEDDAVADALLQIAGAAGTGGDPAFMQG